MWENNLVILKFTVPMVTFESEKLLKCVELLS